MAGPANQRAVASIVFALVTLSAPLHAQSEADVWGAVVEGPEVISAHLRRRWTPESTPTSSICCWMPAPIAKCKTTTA